MDKRQNTHLYYPLETKAGFMSGLVVCGGVLISFFPAQHKPLESNQGLPCGVLDVARCFTPTKHTGLNRTRQHNHW